MASNRDSTVPIEVQELPYYFPAFSSKEEVIETLSSYIRANGAFLLRNSTRSPGQLIISVVHDLGVKHIQIQCTDGKYHLSHSRTFESVAELMTFYADCDVPNREGLEGVRLTLPVTVVDVEEEYASNADDTDGYYNETGSLKPVSTNGIRSPISVNSPRPYIRPPPPPPPPMPDGVAAGAYAEVRDTGHNHAPELIQHLKQSETCECGLHVEDASLPKGWSVHMTSPDQKRHTKGVYFVSPDDQSTWHLPREIQKLLKDHQRTFLRSLGYPLD